jgi:hypothetical protein
MLKTEVENAIGSKLDGDFVAANYQPGFNYAIKQQYYNPDSLSALNSLVTETDGIPTIGGVCSTLYNQVIGSLEYGISSADQAKINQEETAQSALTGTIIDLYNDSGLDDPPKDYPTMLYIMNQIKTVTGTDYLHVDMQLYPNLSQLCNKLSEYARNAVFTTKFQNAWNDAYDRMEAIARNIKSPAAGNGGLATAAGTFSIGWDKLPETAQLLASLKQGNTVSFSLTTDSFSESDSDLHFESHVTVKVPFNWFFNIKVRHEHSYDLSQYAQSESKLSVSVTFNGITTLAAVPTPLSDDNTKGWFAPDILAEAAAKSGKDATGYQLHGSEFDPAVLFGKNGELKRLKTFVISQQPVISLHFSKFDCTEMQKLFTQQTDIDFSLFGGIISGDHHNDYSFSDYAYNSDEQTLDVTISPAPIGDSGSTAKQTAFVLGGVAEYYGQQ